MWGFLNVAKKPKTFSVHQQNTKTNSRGRGTVCVMYLWLLLITSSEINYMKTLMKITLNSTNFSLVALVYFSLHRDRVKTSVKSLSSTLLIRPRSLFLSFYLNQLYLSSKTWHCQWRLPLWGFFLWLKKKSQKNPRGAVYTLGELSLIRS